MTSLWSARLSAITVKSISITARVVFGRVRINADNIHELRQAWIYRTGDISDGEQYPGKSTFKATPILHE